VSIIDKNHLQNSLMFKSFHLILNKEFIEEFNEFLKKRFWHKNI